MPAGTAEQRTRSRPDGLLGQLLRFGLVGVVSATADYGSLLVMVTFGVWQEPARALSFVLGSTTAYLLNRRWTFVSRRDAKEAVAVAAVYAATFVLILTIYSLVRHSLPTSPWQVTIAWVVSQGIGTSFNFLTQRLLIFRR
ncbi:GtrA family protein [Saccharopolyspora gloriosae]|nr:GtrA family protein [Saccharopolyspora gloriosae]